MVSMQLFEKMFYDCSSIDIADYPLVSEDEFTNMDIIASKRVDTVSCFSYYCYNNSEPYIDIYIWDILLEDGYKRFVISEGYCFNEEDEKFFLEYMSRPVEIEPGMIQLVYDEVKKHHEYIHLVNYSDVRHILLHLYYTLHESGPREILFKANLNWVAVSLGKIEGYNIIGSTPQDILGVNIKMLRALNDKECVKCLARQEDREELKNIYSAFHNYIPNNGINRFQLNYLKECYFSDEKPKRKILELYSDIWSDSQYYAYMRYHEQKQIVKGYYSCLPEYPPINQLERFSRICDIVEKYVIDEDYFNKRITALLPSKKIQYRFENDTYTILIPGDVKAIIKESEQQKNCLYQYIGTVSFGETTILFMRDKSRLSQSLVTLEVRNGAIVQAFRSFNKVPNEQEIAFIEEFAKEKNLRIEIETDDETWFEENDEWDVDDEV